MIEVEVVVEEPEESTDDTTENETEESETEESETEESETEENETEETSNDATEDETEDTTDEETEDTTEDETDKTDEIAEQVAVLQTDITVSYTIMVTSNVMLTVTSITIEFLTHFMLIDSIFNSEI